MNTHEIQNLAIHLLDEFGLFAQGWRFDWDNGKRRLGACHYQTRRITMSRYLVQNCDDAEVRETLLHEIAHALTPGHHHDSVWRAKLVSMGGTGKRTHSVETVKGRYDVMCSKCGVVGNKHAKQGTWKYATATNGYYTHRNCGGSMWLQDRVVAVQVPVHATPTQIKHALAASSPSEPTIVGSGPACRCQCGGFTKGGKYLPGHDARHVSQVFDEWLKSRIDIDGAKAIFAHSPALQAKIEKRIAAHASTYKG